MKNQTAPVSRAPSPELRARLNIVLTVLLAVLLAVVGAYLVTTAALAVDSGVLVPKSPQYPVELASQPILFWILVSAVVCAGFLAIYCAWLIGRELWTSHRA